MTRVYFRVGAVMGLFLFTTTSRPALGPTQPLIQWVLGLLTWGCCGGVHEAGLSSASSAEVKNVWIYTFSPQYIFIGVMLN